MGFAFDIKKELSSVVLENDCCRRAEAYGFLLFSRFFNNDRILFQSENESVVKRFAYLLKKTVGINICVFPPINNKGLYYSEVPQSKIQQVLDYFYHTGKEVVLRINRANIEEDCCQYSFIRGAFMACGTICNPEKQYHAEFLIHRKQLSLDFITLLEELELNPKITSRNNSYVIYFKDSSSIEDLLTMMHAINSSLSLMNVKIEKDIRNRINRRTNCETANIDKTLIAVKAQQEAIEIIENHGGLEILPPELYSVAKLRKDNPYSSLSELTVLMNNELSKSGINHRLKKIIEYSENILNGDKYE